MLSPSSLAVLYGVGIGVALGLLGGGGSVLAVPVFVYVLAVPTKPAIAMAFAVVCATSLAAAVPHWRAQRVRWGVAALFGGCSMLGASVGTRLAAYVRGPVQLVLFSLVLLGAAASMLRRRAPLSAPAAADGASASAARATQATAEGTHTLRDQPWPRLLTMAGAGVAVGVLTGLVGVGGGFLLVPALASMGLPMPQAVGTSLVVIAVNSAVSFLGNAARDQVAWASVGLVLLGTVPGTTLGARLHRHLPPDTVRRVFGIGLLLLGAFMLWQNGRAL